MHAALPARSLLAATLLVAGSPAAFGQNPPAGRGLPPLEAPPPFAPRPYPPLPPPPPPYGGPMRVTTDTAEYCAQLAERVARAQLARPPTAPRDRRALVEELAAEGEQMCAAGRIRGGLMRLRRAWSC